MNKHELIDEISESTGFTKADVLRFLQAYVDRVMKSLKKGKDVQMIGFGTFKIMKRKARIGRNPQTGKTLKIAAKKVPVFRPGTAFKKAVQ